MSDRPFLPITPATRVADLLEAYPELEETLIAQAPAFRRLRNPVLRRTVARVASLEQAASVGGVAVRELVAALRTAAGQDPGVPANDEPDPGAGATGAAPTWLDEGRVVAVIDADAMLDAGEVPLARVNAAAAALAPGEVLQVDSAFRPTPLLEALDKQGYPCFVREDPPGRFATFVGCRDRGPVRP